MLISEIYVSKTPLESEEDLARFEKVSKGLESLPGVETVAMVFEKQENANENLYGFSVQGEVFGEINVASTIFQEYGHIIKQQSRVYPGSTKIKC